MPVKSSSRGPQSGLLVRVHASAQAASFLTQTLVSTFGRGVQIHRGEGPLWRLEIWLPESSWTPRAARRLDAVCEGLTPYFSDPQPPSVEIHPHVHHGRLPKGEKRFFRTFRATENIMILPWGEKPSAEKSRQILVMEIGKARGTGLHPTTRSCLRLLEAHLSSHGPSLALDVGTGTGILALAAASMGVPRVFAIDVDSHSVNIARRNVRHNRLTGRIKVRCRDVAQEGGKYPLILVNLSHKVLVRRSKALLHCICPGGRMIVGGIRRRRHQEILSRFCPPLEIEAEDKEAWWQAFVLMRKGAGAV